MKGSKQPRLSQKFAVLQHSHKKRKDSVETRAVLLVFCALPVSPQWLCGNRQLMHLGTWCTVVIVDHLWSVYIYIYIYTYVHRNSDKAVLTVRFFFHFPFLLLQCTGFWGSCKDRYKWKRLSQMLPVCFSLDSHSMSMT